MNWHITKVKNSKDKLDTLLMNKGAQLKWVWEGNANTSYFHKITTSRNSRLKKVNWFEMDNILISDQAKATNKFTEFGRAILGTQQYSTTNFEKPVLTNSVAPPSP